MVVNDDVGSLTPRGVCASIATVRRLDMLAPTGGGVGADFYSALHSARQLSSMRLEKPHSLSYQASTLSSLPFALVWLASKIDDSGLWLKSLETSGKVL